MNFRPTPFEDLLGFVVGGEAHAIRPRRHAGGEWDPWNALPVRRRRSLIGAAFARRGAMAPDELADVIERRHPALDGQDPLEWYFAMCARVLLERRQMARLARLDALVARAVFGPTRTYYDHRNAWCLSVHGVSLWEYRKMRGWS